MLCIGHLIIVNLQNNKKKIGFKISIFELFGVLAHLQHSICDM